MRAQEICFEMSEEQYRDMLDEIYGDVEICGQRFSSGRALQELDPTAFRCGQTDYESDQPSRWMCDECKTEHETEDEAKECCKVETA